MMAEAIGITKEAAAHYIIGNVHRAEDAFPSTDGQKGQDHDGE